MNRPASEPRLPTITEIAMKAHTMCALEPVIDLPFLAREINDAHRQVLFHGKSMLMEAKRAGQALLQAKRRDRHGGFGQWVEGHCECSYPTAREYMRVARIANSKMMDLHQFEGGIRKFLDAHATPRQPEPAAPASSPERTPNAPSNSTPSPPEAPRKENRRLPPASSPASPRSSG